MKNNFKIYTTDNCANCNAAKEMMGFHGIEFEEVAVHKLSGSEQEDTLNMLRDKGFGQFPVISVNDWEQSWAGFHPDKVEKFSKRF